MLPGWAQKVSLINPIYWMISGLRYSTLSIEEISNVTSLITVSYTHLTLPTNREV